MCGERLPPYTTKAESNALLAAGWLSLAPHDWLSNPDAQTYLLCPPCAREIRPDLTRKP